MKIWHIFKNKIDKKYDINDFKEIDIEYRCYNIFKILDVILYKENLYNDIFWVLRKRRDFVWNIRFFYFFDKCGKKKIMLLLLMSC